MSVRVRGAMDSSFDSLYVDDVNIVPGPGTQIDTYAYDAVGNRLSKNATAYTYGDADQMLTAAGVSYGYDVRGNQTNRGSDTFSWDHENRMTQAVIGGQSSTYAYNGDGVRTGRTTGGQTSSYVWDIAARIPVILQDITGTNTTTYVYGLGLISTTDNGGTQTYRTTDGLGSTVNLTDSSGNVQVTYSYDAFGAIRSQSGSSGNYWLFAGEQRDSESGYDYLRARYYDSAAGRFVSDDPFGGGYGYAGNSPANFVDPLGLYMVCPDIPDPVWGYVCFDSTQVELPACDPTNPWDEGCYIWTPEGNILLYREYGNACAFADGTVARCRSEYFDPMDWSAAEEAAITAASGWKTLRSLGLSVKQIGLLMRGFGPEILTFAANLMTEDCAVAAAGSAAFVFLGLATGNVWVIGGAAIFGGVYIGLYC